MVAEDVRTELLKIPWFQEQKPEYVIQIAGISRLRTF